MSRGLGACLVAAFLLSCGSGSGNAGAGNNAAAVAASRSDIAPYAGSYSTSDGDVLVIARMGWFFDLNASDYRTIYATGSVGHFTIGRAFEEATPKGADLVFAPGTLRVVRPGMTSTARRIEYRQTDVIVPSGDAMLVATITEPLGVGPHPGIVVVHGSERGQRYFYDVWVAIYAAMGLAVLTYDKRGGGASTGAYPGEFPTPAALDVYADDAAATLAFLARWPGIDPRRVGFHGGSQGGWTVPLAMQRHPGHASYAVLVSAPATTVDQTDLWSSFSGGGAQMPADSNEQMLGQVRATHSGYDPAPVLRAVAAPVLWILGTNDRTVPTQVCIEVLNSLHKPNFTVQQVPTGHGLLVNSTGLDADDARSPGLAPQLVPTLKAWLGKVLAF